MIEAGGRNYFITHPASADALFDEKEFEEDESIPYWADVWPSSIALARWVSRTNIAGKRTIELGCGVGFPSVVALDRGADEIFATDHYPGALDFAAYNAMENVGRELSTALLDWRRPDTSRFGNFDFVLAADVLYERRNVPVLVDLVPKLLTENGEMLLADPGRFGGELFVEEMEKRGFENSRTTIVVEQGRREVKVVIHRLERTNDV